MGNIETTTKFSRLKSISSIKHNCFTTGNHVFRRAIWDKLPERIFENFQIARVKRGQFENFQ